MAENDMLAALQSLLAKTQQESGVPANGSWTQPQPATGTPITGISIPVKVETPIGSVRVDLHLPAECGQSPQALIGAIQTLFNAGYPVDAWQPRDSGGGWGGNQGGSGWGNRGGSYGGGGYNRGGFGGGRRW